MYCRNCGAQMDPNAAICVKCGVPVGTGAAFCPNCGTQTGPGAAVCTTCGMALTAPIATDMQKSKMAAGLLGIFLGSLGVHNFYLGYTGKAIAQLLITILTCGLGAAVTSIWGLIEGFLILTGSINVDGHGTPLRD